MIYAACAASVFRQFSAIRYNLGQLEPKSAPLGPLLAERHVLCDLVAEVAHVLARLAHPVLTGPRGTRVIS